MRTQSIPASSLDITLLDEIVVVGGLEGRQGGFEDVGVGGGGRGWVCCCGGREGRCEREDAVKDQGLGVFLGLDAVRVVEGDGFVAGVLFSSSWSCACAGS